MIYAQATSTSPLIQFCVAVSSAADKQRTGLITQEEFEHVFKIQNELAHMYLEEVRSWATLAKCSYADLQSFMFIILCPLFHVLREIHMIVILIPWILM